ncbi:putative Ectonucleotide pyrophosphatase/phosphodiesterase family member 3 [Hypsibius exemplaris]|uniref:Ectonucleotide pyrophosphatase/phosphodiesterase family member 3 n=1 Tax=Hypsibius exemplaris TaxID=2072580 RepID=A0A1W0WQ06_HYPEX|nr:putative Ectonucleotide pyrophosphatase/phosphodiesterase family member 3 [Hypsibius exemplaris]
MSSSRRSSQSESTWSGQWDDQVQDVSASTDVAIQVGSHALTEKARPYYCLKVTGLVLLILALIAGALIGGYLLRRYVVELKNKGQDSSLQFGNWKDSECQQLNRSTTTSQCSLGNNQKPTLLIICLSGFRPDFITKDATPALLRIKNCGVHAPSGLRPAFPTNSMPNQYTIATGLHPESHGIVDDTFRDHDTGKVFDGSRGQTGPLQNDPGWWKGEPIWQTAKNQGKRAFVYHWAGSEVVGRKPDESVGYQTNTPLKQQFEKVTGWVTASGADRPAIVMAFIDEPATTGQAELHGYICMNVCLSAV